MTGIPVKKCTEKQIKSIQNNICYVCKNELRDVSHLMMGPKWLCENCDYKWTKEYYKLGK